MIFKNIGYNICIIIFERVVQRGIGNFVEGIVVGRKDLELE